MRQDYKVALIILIIFFAIIGALMLGTDATQVETSEQEPRIEHGCGPGCGPGCGLIKQKLSHQQTN